MQLPLNLFYEKIHFFIFQFVNPALLPDSGEQYAMPQSMRTIIVKWADMTIYGHCFIC